MVSCGKLTSPAALRQPLERLYRDFDYKARLGRDAIQYPLRYADAADREIVALLTACLAYGRVDLFGRALERALSAMGPSPAAFVREFDAARDAAVFAGFIYRFNRPRDLGLGPGVPPSRLLIPVATHVEKRSGAVGLTRRRSGNWKMAEEIPGRLALLDPADPVKYDFALCHTRMAGDCLDRRDPVVCRPCGLREVCRHWKRGAARRRRR